MNVNFMLSIPNTKPRCLRGFLFYKSLIREKGSLTKLQQVMGHSSLQVSLTYLRGLEVKQLDAEDMPIIWHNC